MDDYIMNDRNVMGYHGIEKKTKTLLGGSGQRLLLWVNHGLFKPCALG